MDYPVFRLEGVVHTRDETEDFEGPLALILQLLSKNRIEIEDISISLILEQYLAYLDEMAAMNLEVASEFVSMASYLVYIKTKMLLTGSEEVTELDELKLSLEELARRDIYAKIKAVSDQFSDMYTRGGGLMTKPPEYIAPKKEYKYCHEKEDLINALLESMGRELIKRGEVNIAALPIPRKTVYPVSSKARELVNSLKEHGIMYVKDLFLACSSRSELVATFIAVLELCRMGSVILAGEDDERQTISFTGSGDGEIIDDYGFEEEKNGTT